MQNTKTKCGKHINQIEKAIIKHFNINVILILQSMQTGKKNNNLELKKKKNFL